MKKNLIAVGFEPTPVTTGALNQRLRPLGHATLLKIMSFLKIYPVFMFLRFKYTLLINLFD